MSDRLHPQTIACVQTRAQSFGFKVHVVNLNEVTEVDKSVSAILFQYPDTDGNVHDLQSLIDKTHAAGVSNAIYHRHQQSLHYNYRPTKLLYQILFN